MGDDDDATGSFSPLLGVVTILLFSLLPPPPLPLVVVATAFLAAAFRRASRRAPPSKPPVHPITAARWARNLFDARNCISSSCNSLRVSIMEAHSFWMRWSSSVVLLFVVVDGACILTRYVVVVAEQIQSDVVSRFRLSLSLERTIVSTKYDKWNEACNGSCRD